jgi:hypothetical protein
MNMQHILKMKRNETIIEPQDIESNRDEFSKNSRFHRKYFVNLKKYVFESLKKKYSSSYMFKLYKKEDLKTMKNYNEIPTLFQYYKIVKLINKDKCHYLTIFNENNIFDDEKEYLISFFTKSQSIIILHYNAGNALTYLPSYNLFGSKIYFYLGTYLNKIKKINEEIFKKELGIKTNKIKNVNINKNNLNTNLNFLDSLLENLDDSSDYTNEIEYSKYYNNKNNRKDSIKSIKNLIDKIQTIEDDKKNIKPTHKKQITSKIEPIIIPEDSSSKVRKKKKSKRSNTQKYNKDKHFIFGKTPKTTKRGSVNYVNFAYKKNLINYDIQNNEFKENSIKSMTESSFNIDNFFEEKKLFKTTLNFLFDKQKKQKQFSHKQRMLNEVIKEFNQNKLKESYKYNNTENNSFKRSFKSNIPMTNMLKNNIIKMSLVNKNKNFKIYDSEELKGINDFMENERQTKILTTTQNLIKNINKKLIMEKEKLKNSFTIDKIIKNMNIYGNDIIFKNK